MPVSELDEIPRYAGQYFGIARVHGNVIFDANSPDARHVNPRFNRNHESRFQSRLLSPRHPRILKYFETQSVPSAMSEMPVQFVTGQNLPRRGIHVSAADPNSDCRYCRDLRFQDRPVPLFHARRSSANIHRARNVAAIVREYSTQV
jgi:hypothetical protein